MTTEQPEALRLANELERWLHVQAKDRIGAAAELRRLHDLLGKANALARIRYEELEMQKALVKEAQDMAIELSGVNAELLEALRDFSAYVHAEQSATDGAVQYSNTQINRLAFKARAAIAKAEGRA